MPNLETIAENNIQSSRAQEIVTFAREELNRFRSGELPRISSNEELRARFGYARTASFYPVLNRVGLITERRLLLRETGGEKLTPSRQTAWMLGLLSGAGSVDVDRGRIALHTQNDYLLDVFRTQGQKLFSADMKDATFTYAGKESRGVKFYDRRVSRMLGDFRKEVWTKTILEKHQWLFDNPEFIWGFLEGFAELRGTINRKGIAFGTKYPEVAEFLGELLTKVDIQNFTFVKKGDDQKLLGIAMRNHKDKKRLAENIHLRTPHKEDALEKFRITDEEILVTSPPKHKRERGHRPQVINNPKPRNNRKAELIGFVENELEKYRAGEITALSSSEDLRVRFGYADISQVNLNLRKAVLSQERKTLLRETPADELIFPSPEWAWMIGILAHGGSIARNGKISFTNSESELRDVIKSRGERLFGISATIPPLYGSEKSPTIVFNSVRYARALGSFTRDAWVNTVLDRHDWILRDDRYTWTFLEGVFGTRGSFYRNPRKSYENIVIKTVFRKGANFLAELMVRLGIEHPTIRTNRYASEGIAGVEIASLPDIKHFAEHIHSLIPRDEEHLRYYRDLDIEDSVRPITQEDAIREWNHIIAILGHTPSKKEVEELKRLGLTEFRSGVYTRRFDHTSSRKNFGIAREALGKLSKGRTFQFDEKQIQQARAIFEASQVKKESYVPPNRIADDDIIREWIKITYFLGHTPTTFDLQQLRKQGKTNFSYKAFVRRFGDGHSFQSAVESLNRIVGLGTN